MTTIAIVPESASPQSTGFRAIAGAVQSVGRTAGEALDAITAQLGEADTGTLVVIQQMRSDQFFTDDQRRRLGELMGKWRDARDTGQSFAPAEQAELDALVEAELRAAPRRAAALVRALTP